MNHYKPIDTALLLALYNRQTVPLEFIVLMANESFQKKTGMKEKNLIGKGLGTLFPGLQADSINWNYLFLQALERGVWETRQVYSIFFQKRLSIKLISPSCDHVLLHLQEESEEAWIHDEPMYFLDIHFWQGKCREMNEIL